MLGAMLIFGAVSMFTGVDASAKYLAGFFPLLLIVWSRFAGAMVTSVALAIVNGRTAVWRTEKPLLQLLRGFLLLLGTIANFTAVSNLPLSVTATIMFTYPLLVAAFAPMLLKESLPSSRWLYLVVSFAGVLIIMRPGTDAFHWAMLASLIAALATSLYGLTTRAVAGSESSTTSSFYAALAGTVLPIPFLFSQEIQMPDSFLPWVVLVLVGMLFAAVGHLIFTHAHRFAPAPVLAPYIYSQIVTVVVVGYVVFGDLPDAWTVVGCLVIVSSSLLYLRLEWRAAKVAVSVDEGL